MNASFYSCRKSHNYVIAVGDASRKNIDGNPAIPPYNWIILKKKILDG